MRLRARYRRHRRRTATQLGRFPFLDDAGSFLREPSLDFRW